MEKSPKKIFYDNIKALKVLFENAIRQGSEKDIPEGSRFITISDTLANQIAKFIETIREKVNEYEREETGEGFEPINFDPPKFEKEESDGRP